ncbi:MAG: prepilin peptidase [Bacteroidota bacterium]
MADLISILGLGTAGFICLSDIRTRQIHIGLFLALLMLGVINIYFGETTYTLWDNFGNLLLTSTIIAVVWIASRLRGHQQVMDKLIGWGDVAMLVGLSCWFSFQGFIWFYAWSTCLIAILVLVSHLLRFPHQQKGVPLAGYWALAFAWVLIERIFSLAFFTNPYFTGVPI